MRESELILLTGFMGAGKTTIGAALARLLHRPMIDLDEHIVARAGRSIPMIIDQDGEEHFRQMEADTLRDVLENETMCVIALGGGTLINALNRALIKEHNGFTIWLDAPFELCWQRIARAGEDTRPLARDKEKARRLYEERRAIYEQAMLRVKVSDEVKAEVFAAKIKDSLKRTS